MRVPVKDIIYTNGTDAEEPYANYGGKQEANLVCAITLKGKQAYQYDAGTWNFYICQVLQVLLVSHVPYRRVISKFYMQRKTITR